MTGAAFAVRTIDDVTELVVTGRWSTEATATVKSTRATRLILNYALGFNEPSLDFLEGLNIDELVLLDPGRADLQPVYTLSDSLRAIEITTDPSVPLDLSSLPRLENLGVHWAQVAGSIAQAPALRSVFFTNYTASTLEPLAALALVESLVLKDRPKLRSLSGIDALTRLTNLEIYGASTLDDISPLRSSQSLVSLALEGSRRLSDIEPIANCSQLRELNLSDCGDLQSLSPLNSLDRLQCVYMWGDTRIIDGNLIPISSRPELRELRMGSRRHYRPTVRSIMEKIS